MHILSDVGPENTYRKMEGREERREREGTWLWGSYPPFPPIPQTCLGFGQMATLLPSLSQNPKLVWCVGRREGRRVRFLLLLFSFFFSFWVTFGFGRG